MFQWWWFWNKQRSVEIVNRPLQAHNVPGNYQGHDVPLQSKTWTYMKVRVVKVELWRRNLLYKGDQYQWSVCLCSPKSHRCCLKRIFQSELFLRSRFFLCFKNFSYKLQLAYPIASVQSVKLSSSSSRRRWTSTLFLQYQAFFTLSILFHVVSKFMT